MDKYESGICIYVCDISAMNALKFKAGRMFCFQNCNKCNKGLVTLTFCKINDIFRVYFNIYDMIMRNESDVGDVDFEILAKTVFKFVCFILFLALSNPS